MGIWERLGDVVKSYLHDDADIQSGEKTYSRSAPKDRYGQHDPDLDAAYEELDEFLGGKKDKLAGDKTETGEDRTAEKIRPIPRNPVPPELRQDFDELGLSAEASLGECKEAYKKLLKIHHPDRHAVHEGNMKKATEKTARVNAAYSRLEKWFLATGQGR